MQQLDRFCLEVLIEFFERLVSGDLSVITYKHWGLCGNSDEYLVSALNRAEMQVAAYDFQRAEEYGINRFGVYPERWPEAIPTGGAGNFSGDYPIGGSEEYQSKDLYIGESLERRVALASWILEQLKEIPDDYFS